MLLRAQNEGNKTGANGKAQDEDAFGWHTFGSDDEAEASAPAHAHANGAEWEDEDKLSSSSDSELINRLSRAHPQRQRTQSMVLQEQQ